MNNLKRVLSLGLAGTMLSGMMMVGAGAAGTKDFTDTKEIQNKEAVNTMVSLNIIAGKDDGSFAPEETVTRAQMAKMITIALHGGKEPVLGTKATPTYTDIKGHWAESYIEYCSSNGIISGQGDGSFNPDGSVTGSQAVKMVLTAMGYDSTVFNFTGMDWEINVNSVANKPENDLYNDLDGLNPAEGLSRDDAAQIIYNGLQAETMSMNPNMTITNGEITYAYQPSGKTLLKDKYNVDIYEGVLMATGEYDLTALATNSADAANKDGFVVDVDAVNGKSREQSAINGEYFKAVDTDLTDYMGQYVKVLYNTSKDTLFGVYPVTKKNTVVTTDVSKVSYPTGETNKVKIDGELYTYETTGGSWAVDVIMGETSGVKNDTYNETGDARADTVIFIDNDGNGKFDLALVKPVGVAEVTFLSSTSVTLANQTTSLNPLTNGLSQKLEDIEYPEDLKKGDFVITSHNYYTDNDHLQIVEKVAGAKVAGVKRSGGVITEYQVDGEWLKPANGYTVTTAIKSGSAMDMVSVNGIIFYAKLASSATGSKDVALIYQMGEKADEYGSNTMTAKIMLADGTKKTVTVAKLFTDANETTNELTKDGKVRGNELNYIGAILTYKVNNDGNYEFTKLVNSGSGQNNAGYDTVNATSAAAVATGGNTIGGYTVADDAAIILMANINNAFHDNNTSTYANAVKLITGKEYKSLAGAKFTTAPQSSILVGKDADGFSRVRVASIIATAEGTATATTAGYNGADDKWNLGVFTGSNFGYLVNDAWTETVDGTAYNVFEFWNGTEVVTMREKNSTASTLVARNVFAYDVVDDTTIKNVSNSSVTTGAVQAYSAGANKVNLDGTEYKITNETVILNVDDGNKAGVDGNSVSVAREIGNTGIYVNNAYYRVSGDEVQVLVVDVVKNQVYGLASTLTITKVSTTDGLGVGTGNKIACTNPASPAVGDYAEITNYGSVSVSGSTITFISEDGTANFVYTAVTKYAAPSIAAVGGSGTATNAQVKTALDALVGTNGIASYTVYDAATGGNVVDVTAGGNQTATVYAQFVAANGETVATRVAVNIAA